MTHSQDISETPVPSTPASLGQDKHHHIIHAEYTTTDKEEDPFSPFTGLMDCVPIRFEKVTNTPDPSKLQVYRVKTNSETAKGTYPSYPRHWPEEHTVCTPDVITGSWCGEGRGFRPRTHADESPSGMKLLWEGGWVVGLTEVTRTQVQMNDHVTHLSCDVIAQVQCNGKPATLVQLSISHTEAECMKLELIAFPMQSILFNSEAASKKEASAESLELPQIIRVFPEELSTSYGLTQQGEQPGGPPQLWSKTIKATLGPMDESKPIQNCLTYQATSRIPQRFKWSFQILVRGNGEGATGAFALRALVTSDHHTYRPLESSVSSSGITVTKLTTRVYTEPLPPVSPLFVIPGSRHGERPKINEYDAASLETLEAMLRNSERGWTMSSRIGGRPVDTSS
ncbi:hypothetical protein M231_01013 [Tremella mesenterica]|uniref:Uncharacterized protein n=1 Tax=Tremella mesenterica TaxID=5217 RepID=A0A4Q1BUR1_TREME|nr:hypothetical protein M231_01013 [Tremella mesenterica]